MGHDKVLIAILVNISHHEVTGPKHGRKLHQGLHPKLAIALVVESVDSLAPLGHQHHQIGEPVFIQVAHLRLHGSGILPQHMLFKAPIFQLLKPG